MPSDGSMSEAMLELLHALEAEVLDVHQLTADLRLAPFAVRGTIGSLVASGHIERVELADGRRGWALTADGLTVDQDVLCGKSSAVGSRNGPRKFWGPHCTIVRVSWVSNLSGC